MKKVRITVFLVFSIAVTIIFVRGKHEKQNQFEAEFVGKIEKVEISSKGYHSVVLTNEEEISLDVYRSCLQNFVMPRDSIYKAPETWKLYVFRQKRNGYELVKVCDHQD